MIDFLCYYFVMNNNWFQIVEDRERIVVEQHSFTLFYRCLSIYKSLITATSEDQTLVAFFLNKTAVYQYIDSRQKRQFIFVVQYLFYSITAITPYSFIGFTLYQSRQFGKSQWLTHWISSTKRDIAKRIGFNDIEQSLNICHCAIVDIPRLRVLATLAMVITAGTIYRHTKPRTIDRCIFEHFQY